MHSHIYPYKHTATHTDKNTVIHYYYASINKLIHHDILTYEQISENINTLPPNGPIPMYLSIGGMLIDHLSIPRSNSLINAILSNTVIPYCQGGKVSFYCRVLILEQCDFPKLSLD